MQVAELYDLTRKGLEDLAFEHTEISQNLRELLWRDWIDCFVIHEFLNDRVIAGSPGVSRARASRFAEFSKMVEVVESVHGGSLAGCLDTILRDVASVTASRQFGYFLDAGRSPAIEAVVPADLREAYDDYRGLLDGWLEPLHKVGLDWTRTNGVRSTTLLQVEMRGSIFVPSFNVLMAQAKDQAKEQGAFVCGTSFDPEAGADPILDSLLCASDSEPDTIANELRRLYLDVQMLDAVVKWMVSVSHLGDIYVPHSREFARTVEELIKLPGSRSGEIIVRDAIGILSLGIAQYQRLYGSVTAKALASKIVRGNLDMKIFNLLRPNSYLAGNVAQFVLWELKKRYETKRGGRGPDFYAVYSQAMTYAQFGSGNKRFLALQILLGENVGVDANDDGYIGLRVKRNGEGVFIPLPSPERAAEGRLRFPPLYERFISERRELISLYSEYLLSREGSSMLVLLR